MVLFLLFLYLWVGTGVYTLTMYASYYLPSQYASSNNVDVSDIESVDYRSDVLAGGEFTIWMYIFFHSVAPDIKSGSPWTDQLGSFHMSHAHLILLCISSPTVESGHIR